MTQFLKLIFHISVLFLIILSLFPGSLLGLLLYGNISQQPNLIDSSYGNAFNHFIFYAYISLLGFFLYLRNENFNKLVFGLFFLSIALEVFHLILPNRAFQLTDLIGNILGVLVAFFLVKLYVRFN